MKTNLDYYQHKVDSHNHWKFKLLRREFKKAFGYNGMAGEGMFWMLNNHIGYADHCQLLLTEEKKILLALDMDIDLSELDILLHILEHKCKLIKLTDDGRYYTDITQENLSEVMVTREEERVRKQAYRDRLKAASQGDNKNCPTGQNQVPKGQAESPPRDKQQSKVKETKVLESTDVLSSVPGTSGGEKPKNGEEVGKGKGEPLPDPELVEGGGKEKEKGSAQKEKPPRAARPKKPPQGFEHWQKLVRVYFDFCRQRFGGKPSFPEKDAKAMKKIVEEIQRRVLEDGGVWDEATAEMKWRGFLGHAYLDPWLQKNFLLTNLYSQQDKVFLNLINALNGNRVQTDRAVNGHGANPQGRYAHERSVVFDAP